MNVLKWIGTVTGVVGAVIVASNTGYVIIGFSLYLVSSTCWTVVAYRVNERSLFIQQLVFALINLIGIYRWGTE